MKLYVAGPDGKFECIVECSNFLRKDQYSNYNVSKYITDKAPRKCNPMEFAYYDPETDSWSYRFLEKPKVNEFRSIALHDGVEWRVCEFTNLKHDIQMDNKIYTELNEILGAQPEFRHNVLIPVKRTRTITVFIPCYNKAKYIVETLTSVLNQSRLPESVVILLMDEESISMKDKLESFNPIVKCIVGENKSIPEVRNYFASICTTTDLIHLNADDILEEHCIELLDTSPCDFVFSTNKLFCDDCDVIDALSIDNTCSYTNNSFHNIFQGNVTGLYFLKAHQEIGGFDETTIVDEDIDFKISAWKSEFSIDFVKNAVVLKLNGASNELESHLPNLSYIRKHANTYLDIIDKVYSNLKFSEKCYIDLMKYVLSSDTIDDNCKMTLGHCRVVERCETMDTLTYDDPVDLSKIYEYPDLFWFELIKKIAFHKSDLINNALKPFVSKNRSISSPSKINSDISVLIPCYKQSNTVVECVKSFLSDIEYVKEIIVLLMDDESYVLESELKSIHKKIKPVISQRRFASEARNHLASIAKGSWLLFMDGDDELVENTIHTKIQGIVCDALIIQQMPNATNDNILSKALLSNTTSVFNKKFFTKLGGFDPTFTSGSEDTDIMFKALLNGVISTLSCCGYRRIGEECLTTVSRFCGKTFELIDRYKYLVDAIGEEYLKYPDMPERINFGNFMLGIVEAYRPVYKFLKDTFRFEEKYKINS